MKHHKGCSALLLTIAAALTCQVEAAALTPTELCSDPQVYDACERFLDIAHTPSFSLTMVSGNETGYLNWGCENLPKGEALTENTRFQIGSVSKAFTALSVLLLQEEGKLSTTDPVSDYLPWFHVTYQGEDADVRIWQLLNHCSGLPDPMTKFPEGTDPALKEQTARLAEGLPLDFAPGTQFSYSNLGYDVLAFLTETVAQEPFDEYVTRNILQPIGMTSSGYSLPNVQGYRLFYGTVQPYDAPQYRGCEGDGYVIVTPADMTRWIAAQLGDLTLPEPLANAIEQSHRIPEEQRCPIDPNAAPEKMLYYANGWEHNAEGTVFFHNGTNPNFTAMLQINRLENVGAFGVSNLQFGDATTITLAACDALCGKAFILPETYNNLQPDSIAIYMTLVGGVLLILALIFLCTQKRRLAKKKHSRVKEAILLVLRLVILLPLLTASIAFPFLLGYDYRMLVVWTPLSLLVALLLMDAALLLMLFSSLHRFHHQKHRA